MIWHVQDLTTSELSLVAARGLGRHLGLEAVMPMRVLGGTIRFEDASRRTIDLPNGSIHHRDETLVRLADPWLLAHAARTVSSVMLAVRAGVSVPLGRTEENPFELGRRGLPHQHFQFGTGTWDPLLGIAAGRRIGSVNLSLSGLARFVLAENAHGYRAGNRYAASLQAERSLTRSWHALAGVDFAREQSETWQGRREEEGNLGRTDVLLCAGAARSLRAGSISLTLRVPVVTRAVAAQLDYPLIVSLGWSSGR